MVVSRFTLGAALVVLAQLVLPHTSAAQASREGASFATASNWGTVRLPDVAFDPVNAVYLTVAGNLTKGRFVTQDGAPLGAQFDVPTVGSHNQSARAAYSPELAGSSSSGTTRGSTPTSTRSGVGWSAAGGNGVPLFTGADFFIGAPAGGGNAELGIDVGYADGRAASSSPTTRLRRSTTSSPSWSTSTARWSAGRCRSPPTTTGSVSPASPTNPNTDSFLVA